MRAVLFFSLFVSWYWLNPSFLSSRLPLKYDDGNYYMLGAVDWLLYLFNRGQVGSIFRKVILLQGLPFHYVAAMIFSLAITFSGVAIFKLFMELGDEPASFSPSRAVAAEPISWQHEECTYKRVSPKDWGIQVPHGSPWESGDVVCVALKHGGHDEVKLISIIESNMHGDIYSFRLIC